jgi:hypothetical protein
VKDLDVPGHIKIRISSVPQNGPSLDAMQILLLAEGAMISPGEKTQTLSRGFSILWTENAGSRTSEEPDARRRPLMATAAQSPTPWLQIQAAAPNRRLHC